MIRRKLNVKFLCLLIAGCIVAGVAFYALHAVQIARNAGIYLRQAEDHRQQGELRDAALDYRDYVRLQPEDHARFAAYAELLADIAEEPEADQREWMLAYSTMEEAVRRDPAQDKLRRRLVEFLIESRRYADAADHLEKLLPSNSNDLTLEYLDLAERYCLCLAGKSEYRNAIGRYGVLVGFNSATRDFAGPRPTIEFMDWEKLWSTGAKRISLYVDLAYLLLYQERDTAAADGVMDRMVELNSNQSEAHYERGLYWASRGRVSKARQDFGRALKLDPDDADTIWSLAKVLMDLRQKDDARRMINNGLRKHPRDERMYRSLASIEVIEGNPQQALQHLAQGRQRVDDPTNLMIAEAEIHLQLRDSGAAAKAIDRLKEAGVDPVQIEALQANLLYVEGQWIEAAQRLEKLRPSLAARSDQSYKVDAMLGQCYESSGRKDLARDAYRRALQVANPVSDVAVAARKAIDRLSGPLGSAAQFASRPRSDTSGNTDDESPGNGSGDASPSTLEPGAAAAVKTIQLVRQGLIDQALQSLKSSLNTYPGHVATWTSAIRLVDYLKARPEASTETIRALLEEPPLRGADTAASRLAQALLIVIHPENARERLAQLEADLDQLDKANLPPFWSAMSLAYRSVGQPDEGLRCLRILAAGQPQDLSLKISLFELALDNNNADVQQEILDEIRSLVGPEDAAAKYCEAARLVHRARLNPGDTDNLEKASELIRDARQDRPEWHVLYKLQAERDVLAGNIDDAIKQYSMALELGPPDTGVVHNLVNLLWSKNRFDEADKTLDLLTHQRLASLNPRVVADVYMRTGKQADALAVAEQALELDPSQPNNHVWHGRLLQAADRKTEAEKAYRKAIELAPDIPHARLALIELLVSTGSREQAQRELEEALQAIDEAFVPLVAGRANETMGNLEEAERHYRDAVAARPEDLSRLQTLAAFYLGPRYRKADKYTRAQELLDQLVQAAKDKDGAGPYVAWARRATAPLLARHGDYQGFTEAVALLDQNAVDDTLPLEDALVQARILGTRDDRDSRSRAIALLERVHKQRGLSAIDQLMLAQLYQDAEQWSKCQEIMVPLANGEHTDPAVVAAYCQMLMDRKLLSQVDRYVRHLEHQAPGQEATLVVKARLAAERGDTETAGKLLQRLVPATPEARHVPRLTRIADQLEKFGQYALAEQVHRQCAAVHPPHQANLIRFVGIHGDVDQAMEMLDELMDTPQKFQALQTALDIIAERRPEVGEKYDDKLQGWFDAVGPSFIRSILLARLRDMQQRYDDAESIYRQLLAGKELSGQARAAVANNLAYLLALQHRSDANSLQLVQQAMDHMGPTAELYDTRGIVHMSLKDFAAAESDIKMAAAEDPTPLRYFHLAMVHLEAGDRQSAASAFTRAREDGLNRKDVPPLERNYFERLEREVAPKDATTSEET